MKSRGLYLQKYFFIFFLMNMFQVTYAADAVPVSELDRVLKSEAFFAPPSYLVGRWHVENFSFSSSDYEDSGIIEIFDDGHFILEVGSFAAVGICRSNAAHSYFLRTLSPRIPADKLMAIIYTGDATRSRAINIEYVEKKISLDPDIEATYITLSGTAGCGKIGDLRISVLRPIKEIR